MAKILGTIEVDVERCKGCGVCVVNCPVKALSIGDRVNGKGYRYSILNGVNQCIGCASCGLVCPDSCITVYRRKVE